MACTSAAVEKPNSLMCELCREGYKAPNEVPDLVGMKRAAEKMVGDDPIASGQHPLSKKPNVYYKDRVFLRRVPLTATFTKIKESLGEDKVRALVWLVDKESGAFYGSCIVLLSSPSDVKQIIDRSLSRGGVKVDKKRIKVAEVFQKEDGDDIFNHSSPQKEYPPIGEIMPKTHQ